MTLATDLFNAVGTGASAVWEAVKPYKEAIFGLMTIGGGGAAAFFGPYRKQAKRPEEALDAAVATGSFTPRTTVTRLHGDDRTALGDLHDSVVDLTRAVRHLKTAIEDQGETCQRSRSRDPA